VKKDSAKGMAGNTKMKTICSREGSYGIWHGVFSCYTGGIKFISPLNSHLDVRGTKKTILRLSISFR